MATLRRLRSSWASAELTCTSGSRFDHRLHIAALTCQWDDANTVASEGRLREMLEHFDFLYAKKHPRSAPSISASSAPSVSPTRRSCTRITRVVLDRQSNLLRATPRFHPHRLSRPLTRRISPGQHNVLTTARSSHAGSSQFRFPISLQCVGTGTRNQIKKPGHTTIKNRAPADWRIACEARAPP